MSTYLIKFVFTPYVILYEYKTYVTVHSIDIWNVIESFRENGLNTLDHQSEINVTRLEALVSNLYHNLNKRLPSQQQVSVESLSSVLLNWLLSAYGASVQILLFFLVAYCSNSVTRVFSEFQRNKWEDKGTLDKSCPCYYVCWKIDG